MLHVPPEKVCLEDIIYPHMHTPGYFYCIPVAFTSDIVLDQQLKFLRFQRAIEQSIDDAFTLCSVPPIRASLIRWHGVGYDIAKIVYLLEIDKK